MYNFLYKFHKRTMIVLTFFFTSPMWIFVKLMYALLTLTHLVYVFFIMSPINLLLFVDKPIKMACDISEELANEAKKHSIF